MDYVPLGKYSVWFIDNARGVETLLTNETVDLARAHQVAALFMQGGQGLNGDEVYVAIGAIVTGRYRRSGPFWLQVRS